MQPASSYTPETNFALLLIGSPKSGKTCFCLNFPKPYILDCDNNLAGALRYHNHAKNPIEFWYDDPNIPEQKDRWGVAVKAIGDAIKAPEPQTIVVDGLTLLGQYLEQHILACPNTGKMQDLIIGGEKVMMMELWAPFRNKMMKFVLACRAAKKLFIMTCHEHNEVDKQGAVIGYKPLISGSLRQNLAGLFTDVWRTETKNTPTGAEYSVRFHPKTMMQIGNSLNIKDPAMITTNKTRKEVWSKLSTYLQIPTE